GQVGGGGGVDRAGAPIGAAGSGGDALDRDLGVGLPPAGGPRARAPRAQRQLRQGGGGADRRRRARGGGRPRRGDHGGDEHGRAGDGHQAGRRGPPGGGLARAADGDARGEADRPAVHRPVGAAGGPWIIA